MKYLDEALLDEEVGALFIEGGMSVNGVIIPHQKYLTNAFEKIRSRNGICILDEVQTCMGRTGEWFLFQNYVNVIPDIVTIGKPFGNGHPLAAVIVINSNV